MTWPDIEGQRLRRVRCVWEDTKAEGMQRGRIEFCYTVWAASPEQAGSIAAQNFARIVGSGETLALESGWTCTRLVVEDAE